MEESCDRRMIYQIIFNFYFLTTHLYEINMIKITEKSFKSRSKRNFLNLRVSSRILAVRTSGGRSGSRANSRPWHVSHALRHFRRVPTRLLSRMRAGCVSRDAQGLSMPVNGFRIVARGIFFCSWYLTLFF